MLQKIGLGTAAVVLGVLSLALLPLTIIGATLYVAGFNLTDPKAAIPLKALGILIALPFTGFYICVDKLAGMI